MEDSGIKGMTLPRRLFQNKNIRWVFQNEKGETILDDPDLLWDGMATHYENNQPTRQTYSFRPAHSGRFTFWPKSEDILAIE